MGNNKENQQNKRKNSSQSKESRSTRGNKGAKKAGEPTDGQEKIERSVSSQIETVNNEQSFLSNLLGTPNVFYSFTNSDTNNTNSQIMQMNGQNQTGSSPPFVNMANMGQLTTPGFIGMNNPYNSQPINGNLQTNQCYSTPMRPLVNNAYQTGSSASNSELMKFLNMKFEEIGTRLDKIDSLEKKVSEFDMKIGKLWTELDKRVVKNAENITSITERVEMNDFEMEKAREEVQKLSEENGKLKQSLNDIQSKSMINNLIIGGIEESDQESETQLENSVRSFFSDQLKVPEEKGNDIQFERIHRTGVKRASKPRNIVAVFRSKRDKDYVKSMRPGLRDTVFLHA